MSDMNPRAKRRAVLKAVGLRSKLEMRFQEALVKSDVPFEYESDKLKYVVPEAKRTYTPDFKIGAVYYEVKGLFTREDREKMKLVVEQNPKVTIIMVFDKPGNKLYKLSKTTYADWCDKHGIYWVKMDDFLKERYGYELERPVTARAKPARPRKAKGTRRTAKKGE